MVNRSAAAMFTVQTIPEAIEHARVAFDYLWPCSPDQRPYNIILARAQPSGKEGWWDVIIEAEDA